MFPKGIYFHRWNQQFVIPFSSVDVSDTTEVIPDTGLEIHKPEAHVHVVLFPVNNYELLRQLSRVRQKLELRTQSMFYVTMLFLQCADRSVQRSVCESQFHVVQTIFTLIAPPLISFFQSIPQYDNKTNQLIPLNDFFQNPITVENEHRIYLTILFSVSNATSDCITSPYILKYHCLWFALYPVL